MDIIDQANAQADLALSIALAAASDTTPIAEPNGHCLNCGERVKKERRWCNAECREDWEARQCRNR